MKLNHLNLCVEHPNEARDFFRELFGFRLVDQKGDAIVVMNDGHGFTLVLSKLAAAGDAGSSYPKDFHVGFYLDTTAEVDQLCARLAAAAIIAAEQRPARIRDGYTLYFTALGGLLFEITSFAR
ncbi:VOC family protein [Paenibacillus sacheonensis]|uniref:VOC family protein n=1 Tax=Paenibacillus sacheonensis TaxID=742054 RepID=A0A7X4YRT2_9BACL|nr:VOC family protein [Paenibacillus sacheonensis]MBM7567520.1 catechol 2,3-dioxygenase-like lactoylglutathione lyase family enzyme [Paenibacillus sacheonensis]NBC71375.1 VOC family protein [Paenibacillus sacheonensis]